MTTNVYHAIIQLECFLTPPKGLRAISHCKMVTRDFSPEKTLNKGLVVRGGFLFYGSSEVAFFIVEIIFKAHGTTYDTPQVP